MEPEKGKLEASQLNTQTMTLFKIGQAIENAMIAKGLTLNDLADATEYHPDLIRAMIKGREKAGKNAYNAVAKYLDIQFDMTFPIQEGRPKKENNS